MRFEEIYVKINPHVFSHPELKIGKNEDPIKKQKYLTNE
jgi:hypothetical protein